MNEFSLCISDSSVMRIKFLQLKDKERYAVLKMLVVASGCSGFSYEFDVIGEEEFSRASSEIEDMLVFEKDGAKMLSDVMTLEMVNGSTIDYVEEMIRSAFEVTENPMADGGCSCGVSFTPKDA